MTTESYYLRRTFGSRHLREEAIPNRDADVISYLLIVNKLVVHGFPSMYFFRLDHELAA